MRLRHVSLQLVPAPAHAHLDLLTDHLEVCPQIPSILSSRGTAP